MQTILSGMSSVLFIISDYMCFFELIKLACGCALLALKVFLGENESTSECLLEGMSKFDSTCSVLMNAGFFVASFDHKFSKGQCDHKHVAACSVDLVHTKQRGQTPALDSLIKRLLDLWEPGSAIASALCLCMPCSVGILPPTAGSCSTSLAHISAPAPPHTVHGSY